MNTLNKILVPQETLIKAAIQKLNENAMQILLVVDSRNHLLGTVTDGDIRRGILDDIPLTASIDRIMNQDPRWILETERNRAVELMQRHRITSIPILAPDRTVVDIAFWSDVGESFVHRSYPRLTNRVFVMAGGRGSRLAPFTNILPKPLIPLGEKPIIELIMKQLQGFGFNDFILSLNYKAEMIKLYFSENPEAFEIEYVQEQSFLGTGGSLSLVKDKITESLIICNCDTLLDLNFCDLLKLHRESGHDATIVGVVRHFKIPYGVVEMKNGTLDSFAEKPEYDFVVNAGIYVIEPSVLSLLSVDEVIDMPTLMLRVRDSGRKVGVYPMSGDWIDVGRWEEYQEAIEKMARFKHLFPETLKN